MTDYFEGLVYGDIRKQFLPDEIKLERHKKSYERSQPVVFCVRCGSTTVDQNFRNELRCYECGTTSEWNASKFSIRRKNVGESDVTTAFLLARKEKEK